MKLTKSQVLKVASISLLMGFSGCWPFSSKTEEPLGFQAPTLMAEYVRDAEAADKKYKGKEMILSGVIAAIKQDQGIVILKGTPSGIANSVECELTPEGRSILSQLVQGQGIVTQGRNQGWNLGNTA